MKNDFADAKKTTCRLAWFFFMICTVIMWTVVELRDWDVWVLVMLVIHAVIIGVMTFHPKISVGVQSVTMMILLFWNTFVFSIMDNNLYNVIPVFLAVSILLASYKNINLLVWYIVLNAVSVPVHIYILGNIQIDIPQKAIELIIKLSILFIAELYLLGFIKRMNINDECMQKSIEDAQRAERYKSDFLANMSHEIRTPMNAIVGMCELILREDGLNENVRENCLNIQTSGRSLLSIINDILDFSKIDSGKMELVNDEFNIASTLNDVINMSEARKGNKKIDIIVKADPRIPRSLVGDEVRIRQVIINLMTNAIKFTEKGSVTFTVSCTKQEYGINLFVSVADTGIGITEENIEKLFTSFRQVDTKKNRSVEGTGLGLAISKQLITQMGGFISVRSEYGRGTEFRFSIPLTVKDERPFITIKEPEKIHAAGFFGNHCFSEKYEELFSEMCDQLNIDFKFFSSSLNISNEDISDITHIFADREEYLKNEEFFVQMAEKTGVFVIQNRVDAVNFPKKIKCVYKPFYSISVASALNNENIVLNLNERRGAGIRFTAPKARVLIVDDNAINLKVAAGLMRPYNMQIMTVDSGPAAIKMLRSKDFDLVFMDHMMPEMDGVEATNIIRNTDGEYYKNLPVIALTANAVNGAREMFMSSGFNDFLAKPIELSALDRILRNYLPKEYMQSPNSAVDYGVKERRKDSVEQTESALFEPDKGLAYTGGDEEAYHEILALYVKKGVEKLKYIDELFTSKDWKNYIIEVHALKSTSMSIGAIRLSELAKELEMAGKAESYGVIEKKNSSLLRIYDEVITVIGDYLKGFEKKEETVETVVSDELTEISSECLADYIAKAKEACSGFDADAMVEISEQTVKYSYKGNPIAEFFKEISCLAEDFEYDAAMEKIDAFERSME